MCNSSVSLLTRNSKTACKNTKGALVNFAVYEVQFYLKKHHIFQESVEAK